MNYRKLTQYETIEKVLSYLSKYYKESLICLSASIISYKPNLSSCISIISSYSVVDY